MNFRLDVVQSGMWKMEVQKLLWSVDTKMQEIMKGAASQMDVIHQDTNMFINQEIYAALAVDVVRMDFATNWQKYQQNFNDLLTSFKFSFNILLKVCFYHVYMYLTLLAL